MSGHFSRDCPNIQTIWQLSSHERDTLLEHLLAEKDVEEALMRVISKEQEEVEATLEELGFHPRKL